MTKRRTLPSSNPKFTWNVQDSSHSSFIAFDSAANGKAKNRRSAFTPQKRKDAAELRKRGACLKCKMWRKANLPCGANHFSTSLREVQGPFFEVGCCRYSPEVDDIVQREWGPETHQVLSIPTYCGFDLSALRSRLADIVDDYRTYQLSLFNQDAEEFPDIVIATLRVASRHEAKQPLLRAAELWKALLQKNKGDWFLVFLIIFVLLNTAEIAYEAQLLYVLEHGGAHAGYFVFVFRYYIRRCSFEDAPIFSLSQFEDAAECAKLDGTDREYYKRLMGWRDDILQLELQQRQNGGSSTTEEAPVKQTSWYRQLLFGFAENPDEWPTRIAQQEHSSLD
ncbi:hypothetical protein Z517_10884 [Fonsecaea pedrosoi CBS 271.37]|uniref:Unplaced genomic scaffold supercont1.7, whole genome shotgun sequence n=1 Tax=Fonsecaea pedrosoi CBS 271.37 TaxID=1442368 RepID=A0A0D2GUT0_9EURO|nr:uncharacterized protein Z517_10884 [Fonsecaea pedrosoi CBS 271.37]KIW76139.1 hypothetical protein Z517_10884 [Fonsecaea pedrosoi CBS 271.37]